MIRFFLEISHWRKLRAPDWPFLNTYLVCFIQIQSSSSLIFCSLAFWRLRLEWLDLLLVLLKSMVISTCLFVFQFFCWIWLFSCTITLCLNYLHLNWGYNYLTLSYLIVWPIFLLPCTLQCLINFICLTF